MALDSRTFRSTVTAKEKSKKLQQGTLIAGAGVFFLAFAGIFLPQPILAKWGLIIFFFCFICLAGLLPYRRLTKLERKPNEIVVIGTDIIEYWSGGRKLLTLLQKNITSMSYYHSPYRPGIYIYFNNNKSEKVFLPYFSKSSFDEITELINPHQTGQCHAF